MKGLNKIALITVLQLLLTARFIKHVYKSLTGALSHLRQFLTFKNPLKMMKNAFYFTLRRPLLHTIISKEICFKRTNFLKKEQYSNFKLFPNFLFLLNLFKFSQIG